jgi:hypothetical protein
MLLAVDEAVLVAVGDDVLGRQGRHGRLISFEMRGIEVRTTRDDRFARRVGGQRPPYLLRQSSAGISGMMGAARARDAVKEMASEWWSRISASASPGRAMMRMKGETGWRSVPEIRAAFFVWKRTGDLFQKSVQHSLSRKERAISQGATPQRTPAYSRFTRFYATPLISLINL